MQKYILYGAEALFLILICIQGVRFWRFWRKLPENAELDADQTKALKRHTLLLMCFVLIESLLQIASAVLRIIKGLN